MVGDNIDFQQPVAWAKPEDLERDGYSHSFYVWQSPPHNIECVPLYAHPINQEGISP